MVKIYQILLFSLLSLSCAAQYPLDVKADYNWCFGYGYPPRPWGRSILSFSDSGVDTSWHDNYLKELWNTNSSVSDKNGNLLMYSNGYSIMGANHQVIPGADSINCCSNFFTGYYAAGQPTIQGILMLPFYVNDSTTIVKLIHRDFSTTSTYIYHPDIRYTELSYTNESVDVIAKDVILFVDTITYNELTACRHANGRDWWILQNEHRSKRFYTFLVTPDTVQFMFEQTTNKLIPQRLANVYFNKEGTKYIVAGADDFTWYKYHINIFDFDRCTGLLSNQKKYVYTDPDSLNPQFASSALSANGRYLYIANNLQIWQFDLQASDLLSSKQIVAEYDGFQDSTTSILKNTLLVSMQIAPDNKIYVGSGYTAYLHTIDNPDEGGMACNVNQHSIKLPSLNGGLAMPHYPNYRLGPIDGSPCDTLGIDNLTNLNDKLDNNTEPVKIYPNPATDYITLFVPRITKQWQFALYDIQGREVLHVNSRGAFRSINISHLAQGMYLWKLVYEDGKQENGKMVKQ